MPRIERTVFSMTRLTQSENASKNMPAKIREKNWSEQDFLYLTFNTVTLQKIILFSCFLVGGDLAIVQRRAQDRVAIRLEDEKMRGQGGRRYFVSR